VRILITSSRMPFALAMVRKLADAGHEVFAADDTELAPGSHSKYLSDHFVTASPRQQTEQFVDDVERIAREASIDVVLPAFEETFFLATQHDRLSRTTRLFAPPFATLARLHDKATFQRLVTRLGLPTPETIVATSDEELRAALERFPRYFARAAFSRGGVSLLTNSGPLAGTVEISDCTPTPASPWLVQEFVDGPTVCTYSTVQDGRVTAHCMYRIPRQWKHSTGIGFESMDGTESLAVIEPIVAELGYTGQVSFDFVVTDDGLTLIECNPRATDGALLMPSEQLAEGILASGDETSTVPVGQEVQLDLALIGDGFSDYLRRLPETIGDLARVHDAGDGWHDPLPTMYSALAVAHDAGRSVREHEKLFISMAGDISWDGEPIAGMSDSDRALLNELTAERR
jgi:glutathione synthase/RimK-type ligase-like ATP-grasp enzyme